MDVKDELLHTLDLLKIEKEEEMRQYEVLLKETTLERRIKEGVSWFPLSIRETGYGLGDYPYVIVERHRDVGKSHRFNGGQAVSLFCAKDEWKDDAATGTINFVDRDKMKIIFYRDELPEWLDEGRIGVNLLFNERSYREMERAMLEVIAAEGGRLAHIRDVILGEKEPGFQRIRHVIEIPDLNESQNEAVNQIIAAEDVALVHGPPGTGKTTTIAQAVKQLVKHEKRVVVCAPSNAAADLLTKRLDALGVNVVRIGNLSRIDPIVVSHTLDQQVENHPDAKQVKVLKKQASEYRRMAGQYKRKFGYEERQQRKALYQEAKAASKEAVQMEDYLIQAVLQKAEVITCTLVGVVDRVMKDIPIGTVVIDEAAQALEPATWIPILQAQKVIFAGDPYQLPPTVKSQEAEKKGFNKTLMEKGIERLPQVSLLNTQYRMHETIMGFSNQQFYDGALLADESVADHTINVPEPFNRPLEFIDTAGTGMDEKQSEESLSHFNKGEAEVLRKHLKELLEQISDPISIGIISPYKEQVVHLRSVINVEEQPEHVSLSINTVDSFQGQERDVIYISMVRSNEHNTIGFLSDYRRMNVAMTRARKKLVVIGDSATLGAHKFYGDFLDFVDETDSYRSAWEYM